MVLTVIVIAIAVFAPLLLIGIGAGDPNWVTVEAIRAIERLDVLFVVLKQDELDELVAAGAVRVDEGGVYALAGGG